MLQAQGGGRTLQVRALPLFMCGCLLPDGLWVGVVGLGRSIWAFSGRLVGWWVGGWVGAPFKYGAAGSTRRARPTWQGIPWAAHDGVQLASIRMTAPRLLFSLAAGALSALHPPAVRAPGAAHSVHRSAAGAGGWCLSSCLAPGPGG